MSDEKRPGKYKCPICKKYIQAGVQAFLDHGEDAGHDYASLVKWGSFYFIFGQKQVK